jgi:hypothetical protein
VSGIGPATAAAVEAKLRTVPANTPESADEPDPAEPADPAESPHDPATPTSATTPVLGPPR